MEAPAFIVPEIIRKHLRTKSHSDFLSPSTKRGSRSRQNSLAYSAASYKLIFYGFTMSLAPRMQFWEVLIGNVVVCNCACCFGSPDLPSSVRTLYIYIYKFFYSIMVPFWKALMLLCPTGVGRRAISKVQVIICQKFSETRGRCSKRQSCLLTPLKTGTYLHVGIEEAGIRHRMATDNPPGEFERHWI